MKCLGIDGSRALVLGFGLTLTASFGCVTEAQEASPPMETPVECTGVEVSAEDNVSEPQPGQVEGDPTVVGTIAPTWKLEDVQPQSCGYGKIYGLDSFRGRPTMVVLLWSGCTFCQAQTAKLQEMQYELAAEGMAVEMIIINMNNERNPVEELTNRCTFPIFQDTEAVDAWGLHGGQKDDFYFYDTEGVLRRFMTYGEDDNIILNEAEGYANIKGALVDLVNGTTPPPAAPDAAEPETDSATPDAAEPEMDVADTEENTEDEPASMDEVDDTQDN